MAQKAIGATVSNHASQLPSLFKRGNRLMSKSVWMTPEEAARIKKRNKVILYTSLPVATVLFTALLTMLLN